MDVKPRIVIADDHPVMRMGLRVAIERAGAGLIVAEADRPDALFDVLASEPCDLIVTDLSMPGGAQADGVRMVERIRRLYPTIPIILVTMFTNLSTLRAAIACGVDGVVEKVASADELPVAISTVLSKQSFISDALKRRLREAEADMTGLADLSLREVEVVRMLAGGMTVTQVAHQLNRSIATVSRQKGSAMRRLGLATDVQLFDYARKNGLKPED